ncbi:hypothetical protein WOLCODRAFT_162774 [Wolfiporia cocos MD-104 SS10]|uniref:Uncharacterized protein n=1 Tax=Wolfiporia cocos (strain MD-104) TaxID=742152 RepID=A0A2H3JMF0_WOLCO|nr:hypothetical protein WOLCODRAFT_162774 [Wolfiporia cocos MD-104 SS10]
MDSAAAPMADYIINLDREKLRVSELQVGRQKSLFPATCTYSIETPDWRTPRSIRVARRVLPESKRIVTYFVYQWLMHDGSSHSRSSTGLQQRSHNEARQERQRPIHTRKMGRSMPASIAPKKWGASRPAARGEQGVGERNKAAILPTECRPRARRGESDVPRALRDTLRQIAMTPAPLVTSHTDRACRAQKARGLARSSRDAKLRGGEQKIVRDCRVAGWGFAGWGVRTVGCCARPDAHPDRRGGRQPSILSHEASCTTRSSSCAMSVRSSAFAARIAKPHRAPRARADTHITLFCARSHMKNPRRGAHTDSDAIFSASIAETRPCAGAVANGGDTSVACERGSVRRRQIPAKPKPHTRGGAFAIARRCGARHALQGVAWRRHASCSLSPAAAVKRGVLYVSPKTDPPRRLVPQPAREGRAARCPAPADEDTPPATVAAPQPGLRPVSGRGATMPPRKPSTPRTRTRAFSASARFHVPARRRRRPAARGRAPRRVGHTCASMAADGAIWRERGGKWKAGALFGWGAARLGGSVRRYGW